MIPEPIFIAISILVPIALYYFLPRILTRHGNEPSSSRLLVIGGLLYCVAWYLPSPRIDGENTAFMTHLIGGGIFTGFFWLYLVRQLDIQLPRPLELASLYLLVSGLGVANELFELLLTSLDLVGLTGHDTWWDLLANTLGATLFWVGYRLHRTFRR